MGAIALAFALIFLIVREARVITVTKNPPSSPDGKIYFKFIIIIFIILRLNGKTSEP